MKIYLKKGVEVETDKLPKGCNYDNLNEAITVNNDDVVTISEEELQTEKVWSFAKGVGMGVIAAGTFMVGYIVKQRATIDFKTDECSENYSKKTKKIKKNNYFESLKESKAQEYAKELLGEQED